MNDDTNTNLPTRVYEDGITRRTEGAHGTSTAKGTWVKGGPSPNPAGRGKGVANKFSRKVVEELAAHFNKEGYKAIDQVYRDDPSTYLKIIVSAIPKELLIQVSKDPTQMSDAELAQAAEEERLQQLKVIEHIRDKVGEQIILEATREVMGEDGDDEDAA
jgi:hypothetical protein